MGTSDFHRKRVNKSEFLFVFKWFSAFALMVLLMPPMEKSLKHVVVFAVLFFLHFFANRKKVDYHPIDIKYIVFSLIAVAGLLFQFYFRCNNYAVLQSFLVNIGVVSKLKLTIFTSILGIAAIPGIYMLTDYLLKDVFEAHKLSANLMIWTIKPLLIIFSIYLCAEISIIRANFNYIDDMGRVFEGYMGWDSFSRYISNYLSNYLHANMYLADISPLPQLLSALFLAASGVIVLYAITGRTQYGFIDYCAVVPLGISPYFLECLSYKYDSPYMAISVLAAVFPSVFLMFDHNDKKLVTASFISTMIVCLTYQAASGILPMLVIFICGLRLIKNECLTHEVFHYVISATLGYASAILFFRIFIMMPADNYVSNSFPQLNELISTVLSNYSQYFSNVLNDFNPIWLALLMVLAFGFILFAVVGNKENRLYNLFIAMAVVFFSAILIFGLYPILSVPLFSPRAMYGVGAWIAFVALATVSIYTDCKIQCLSKLVIFALAWSFFTFSFTYGNALDCQKQYTEYRTREVISSINSNFPNKELRELRMTGAIGYAPAIQNTINQYPVLGRLVPVTLSGGWMWGEYEICKYFSIPLNPNWSEDYDIDLPVLQETSNFIIKGDNTTIIVELR